MKITHCETKLTRDSIKNLAKNSNTVGISQSGFETILLKISILSPEKNDSLPVADDSSNAHIIILRLCPRKMALDLYQFP